MELVDTHCHLQFEPYKAREDEVIAEASRVGAKKLICVGTNLADSKLAVKLAQKDKDVWAAVGAHPHEADKFLADPNAEKKLKKLTGENKVVAIGETGLDFYRQLSAEADQETALRAHIHVAQELGLPVIFHVREAWADFWRVLNDYKNIRGVVHSFSSGPKQLEQVLGRGFYVGLNGIMTFTKDEAQLAAAKLVPLNRLLLETDAPFLTPAPNRLELCEPRHVRVVADFLAELRGESLQQIANATTANAQKLFNL